MKAAFTVWQERISPVFDSAQMLLIAEVKDSKVLDRRFEPFNSERPARLVDRFNELGVKVLICGAITERLATVIEAGGIKLIPFIGGITDEVLESYAKGISIIPKFLMPGCRRQRCRQGKKCNTFLEQQKGVNIMPRGDRTGPQGQGAGTGKGQGGCKSGKGGQGSGSGRGQGKGQRKSSGAGQGRGRGK